MEADFELLVFLKSAWAQDHKTKAGDQTQSQASDWLKWRPGRHFSQSDA
jgi:hypothetical protein